MAFRGFRAWPRDGGPAVVTTSGLPDEGSVVQP
jgi:hypothetical protein